MNNFKYYSVQTLFIIPSCPYSLASFGFICQLPSTIYL